jgi:RimJ/RimL family protein N-acetyltransferase
MTDRLLLREFATTDAEHMFQLNQDPEVIRFTGDPPFADVAEARALIAAYDVYALHGFGRWSVFRKDDSEYLGWCGLGRHSYGEAVDLGFRFHRRHWGQGYATEAARAALQLGFTRYRLERIIGRAMRANAASQRVLAKVGMRLVLEFVHDGHDWVQYELSAAEYLRMAAAPHRSNPAAPVYNRGSDAPDQTKDES